MAANVEVNAQLAPIQDTPEVTTSKGVEIDNGTNYNKLERTAEKTYKQTKKDVNQKADDMIDNMVYAEETLIQSALQGQFPSFMDAWKAVDAEWQHKKDALKAEMKGALDILKSARNVSKTNLETGFAEAKLDVQEGLGDGGIQKVGESVLATSLTGLATSTAFEVLDASDFLETDPDKTAQSISVAQNISESETESEGEKDTGKSFTYQAGC